MISNEVRERVKNRIVRPYATADKNMRYDFLRLVASLLGFVLGRKIIRAGHTINAELERTKTQKYGFKSEGPDFIIIPSPPQRQAANVRPSKGKVLFGFIKNPIKFSSVKAILIWVYKVRQMKLNLIIM